MSHDEENSHLSWYISQISLITFSITIELFSERFYEIAGTPGYAAPEIYRKTGYGKKSDIFGCGVLAYIVLSSWSPWNSTDPKQLMVETMTAPVKFYPSHWQGVSDLGE